MIKVCKSVSLDRLCYLCHFQHMLAKEKLTSQSITNPSLHGPIENCGLKILTKTLYVLLSSEYGKIACSSPVVGPDELNPLRSNLNNNQAKSPFYDKRQNVFDLHIHLICQIYN